MAKVKAERQCTLLPFSSFIITFLFIIITIFSSAGQAGGRIRTSLHDMVTINPPTIITIPAMSTTTPPSPPTLPLPPPINNIPVPTPITVPAGPQPPNQPVTTNPVAPPTSMPGQSWCVAKMGAIDTVLQAALDYACGMGAVDCSKIQQGGPCYNPNTLQGHASYAFNIYYQKKPVPTSCDFGGTAAIVSTTNPSVGSCIFPSSSSPSTSVTSSAPPTPTNTTPTTTSSSEGSGVSGSGTPPTVSTSTSNNPASTSTDFGSQFPPGSTTTTSASTSISPSLRPFVGCISLVIYFVTQKIFIIDVSN